MVTNLNQDLELEQLLEDREIQNVVWPTPKFLKLKFTETLQHSCKVEYVCTVMDIEQSDLSQQPHDMKGRGNKLNPSVLFGFAVGYDLDKNDKVYGVFIKYSIQKHDEGQTHHNSNLRLDIKLKAIDAVITMTEDRGYNGGPYEMEEIKDSIKKNETGIMKDYMLIVAKKMESMEIPSVSEINLENINAIKNVGLSDCIEKLAIERAKNARDLFISMGYNLSNTA